jgi:hypothetical protein
LGLFDFLLLLVAGFLLGYSIYEVYSQYRFFNRWERRTGLLLYLEEEMLAAKLGENSGAKDSQR